MTTVNRLIGAAIAGNQVLNQNQQQVAGGQKVEFGFYVAPPDVFSMDAPPPDLSTDQGAEEAQRRMVDPNRSIIKFGIKPPPQNLVADAASGQAAARRSGNV